VRISVGVGVGAGICSAGGRDTGGCCADGVFGTAAVGGGTCEGCAGG
jgi:hypothetical protein